MGENSLGALEDISGGAGRQLLVFVSSSSASFFSSLFSFARTRQRRFCRLNRRAGDDDEILPLDYSLLFGRYENAADEKKKTKKTKKEESRRQKQQPKNPSPPLFFVLPA